MRVRIHWWGPHEHRGDWVITWSTSAFPHESSGVDSVVVLVITVPDAQALVTVVVMVGMMFRSAVACERVTWVQVRRKCKNQNGYSLSCGRCSRSRGL